MKVDFSYANSIYKYNNRTNSSVSTNTITQSQFCSENKLQSYPAVYFCGGINLQKLEADKAKLINKISQLLKENIEESMTPEQRFKKLMDDALKIVIQKAKKRKKIEQEVERLKTDRTLNAQQKNDIARRLLLEFKRLSKPYKPKFVPEKKKEPDKYTDLILLDRFRSALLDGNFDLSKIYKQYYGKLAEIKTLKDLKKAYPLLPLPKNPIDIISNKISMSFSCDMYREIAKLAKCGETEKAEELINTEISAKLNEVFKEKTPEQKEIIFKKLFMPIYKKVSEISKLVIEEDSLSPVPHSKKKLNIVTDIDKQLIEVDYTDFVLQVLKKQYLEMQKPNDIFYEKNGLRIKLSSNNSEYRIEQIPSQIKNFMLEAQRIKNTERNYDLYSVEAFKHRMLYYSENIADDKDEYIDRIAEFYDCRYTDEDIEKLKIFLKISDQVFDKDITLKEALLYFRRNSIMPTGSKKIDDFEQQKRVQQLKAEQKAAAKLKHEKEKFDDAIKELYKLGLLDLAQRCSLYRPKSMDEKELEKSKFIIDTIIKNISKDNVNKAKIETSINRWYKYMEYMEQKSEPEILEAAIRFAKDASGEIDKDKAGKYILNAEALMAYPESLDFASNPDMVKLIIKELGTDDKAVRALCKYDDYMDLTPKDRTYIRKFIGFFDKKDETDKKILEEIIKNDYSKTETVDYALLNSAGTKKVKTTIGLKAKRAIYEHYNLTEAIKFFEAFEEALTHDAAKNSESGVKYLGKNNNKKKGMHELKIKGHDDRLVSYNFSCYFDEFIPEGLHD